MDHPGDVREDPGGRMGVCVKPLYNQYDRALWLLEFIEMYRLLGATDFVFYNHSIGPSVEAVLRHYTGEGPTNRAVTVQVLPWNLPIESQMRIRTEAQFTALNDCNFRLMNRVKYAAMVDVDEFLIPHSHHNLTSLLNELNRPQIASFSFRNAFFYLYWRNSSGVESVVRTAGLRNSPGYLVTQYKTTRLERIHRHGSRSKAGGCDEHSIKEGQSIKSIQRNLYVCLFPLYLHLTYRVIGWGYLAYINSNNF